MRCSSTKPTLMVNCLAMAHYGCIPWCIGLVFCAATLMYFCIAACALACVLLITSRAIPSCFRLACAVVTWVFGSKTYQRRGMHMCIRWLCNLAMDYRSTKLHRYGRVTWTPMMLVGSCTFLVSCAWHPNIHRCDSGVWPWVDIGVLRVGIEMATGR